MIIRSNLATVPIRNYSLYLLGCIFLGVVVVVFTIWNAISLTSSYTTNAGLRRTILNQQRQLQDLESQAKNLQSGITLIKTPGFIAETEFMNNAIKRRTFSWTALFDHFEEVLPPSVKMISILPTVTETKTSIHLELAGQSLSDMLELVRMLERDPAFAQVILQGENTGDVEGILFTISLDYIPQEVPESSVSEAGGPDLVPALTHGGGQSYQEGNSR